ncbi:MAG: hypothetical protein HYV32_03625 [Candidatus Kerfeldbacteria bacterium]|nr:hypothetical protein [Candidatus Kerfeldbacteria bacterium]
MEQVGTIKFLEVLFASTIVFDAGVFLWVLIFNKKKDPIVKIFYGVFVVLLLWESSAWISFFIKTPARLSLLIDQIALASSVLLVFLVTYFIWRLLNRSVLQRFMIIGLAAIAIFFIIAVSIPGVVIGSRVYIDNTTYNYYLTQGPLFFWYYASFIPVFFVLFFLVIQGYRRSQGIQRIRIAYVGFSLLIAMCICLLVACLMPTVLSVMNGREEWGTTFAVLLQVVAGIAASIFTLSTVYTITRYRLMSIQVLLKKSIVYGASLLMSLIVFIFITTLVYDNLHSIFVWIIALILLALCASTYQRKIRLFFNKIFFLDELDLSKNVAEDIEKLQSTHELETAILEYVAGIQRIAKIDVINLFIEERRHHRFVSYFPLRNKESISFDDPVLPLLNGYAKSTQVILWEALSDQTGTKQICRFMEKQNAAVLVILRNTEKVVGIGMLSAKKTGETYTEEEIEAIEKLSKIAGFQLSNCIHWQETLEGMKLKLKEDAYSNI